MSLPPSDGWRPDEEPGQTPAEDAPQGEPHAEEPAVPGAGAPVPGEAFVPGDPPAPPLAPDDALAPQFAPGDALAPPLTVTPALAEPAARVPPPGEPSAADPPAPPARRTRLQRFRSWRFAPIFEILATIGVALALAESVQAAIVKPFVIPTGSMEPTLEPSQRVLVNRLAYDFGSPHRGDIVVFHPPSSLSCGAPKTPPNEPCPKSDPTPSSQYFVKRIMGLPGDHLTIKDGHPVINGHEISNEPYIAGCGAVPACNMPIPITIPKGEYYMLGDNRGDSDDSRYWGPVPQSWIVGEVFATYWPPDRIGIF